MDAKNNDSKIVFLNEREILKGKKLVYTQIGSDSNGKSFNNADLRQTLERYPKKT